MTNVSPPDSGTPSTQPGFFRILFQLIKRTLFGLIAWLFRLRELCLYAVIGAALYYFLTPIPWAGEYLGKVGLGLAVLLGLFRQWRWEADRNRH